MNAQMPGGLGYPAGARRRDLLGASESRQLSPSVELALRCLDIAAPDLSAGPQRTGEALPTTYTNATSSLVQHAGEMLSETPNSEGVRQGSHVSRALPHLRRGELWQRLHPPGERGERLHHGGAETGACGTARASAQARGSREACAHRRWPLVPFAIHLL